MYAFLSPERLTREDLDPDRWRARWEADLHRRERDRRQGAALEELTERWGGMYGAIVRLWEDRLGGIHPVPGLYDVEIRAVICSTNAIESLNACYRRAVKARGHRPTEQTALKGLSVVT